MITWQCSYCHFSISVNKLVSRALCPWCGPFTRMVRVFHCDGFGIRVVEAWE